MTSQKWPSPSYPTLTLHSQPYLRKSKTYVLIPSSFPQSMRHLQHQDTIKLLMERSAHRAIRPTTASQSIDEPLLAMQMSNTAPISMPLAPGCDEECLTTALTRGYMSLDSALYPQTGAMIPSYNTEASKLGFFNGSGGNSNVVPNFHAALNRGNNQDLVNGYNGSPPTLPPTEVSGLDDSTFKVVRLSAEQRKEKIHMYIKKRNERNFSKKIKYACRKTLADSRPHVHGRFAKNEELCEATRSSSQNHDEYGQIVS
ncbi:hypothetical protein ZWY2020_029341 [Hordeum vulgare]|nr:hypothetical protein ZWY2020_029341 [Hordeum vulgare]